MYFVKESFIHAEPARVFAFHELPDALERLTPPWQEVKVVQTANIREVGSRAIIDIKVLGPFTERWVAEHTAYDPPHYFEDVQVDGPFKNWRHRPFVEPHPDGAMLRDEIDYEPPFGWIGKLGFKLATGDMLEQLFEYRHDVTRRWCEMEENLESAVG